MRTMKIIPASRLAYAVFASYTCSLILTLATAQAMASPAADSSPVNCSFSPHLSCVDASDEKTLWQNLHYSDPDKFSVNQTRLYISHSTTSSSYALKTGAQTWQASSGSSANYFYPVLSSDMIYLARSDGFLEKRQADSGALIWSQKLAEGWVYPPIIKQNHIITGGQDRIIWVLDKQTGQTLERVTLDQELVAPLFEVNDLIIGSTFDGQLSAFQIDTAGNRLYPVWKAHLDAPAFAYLANARYLVAADMGGTLHSLDPETGQIRWQKTVHQNALFWNTFYQQSLISLTESGSLTILDIESGALQNKLQFDRHYLQAPIVQGGTVTLYDTTGATQHLTPEILPDDLGKNSLFHSHLKQHNKGS
jgi:outer membrane protein assembly factor BamB